MLLWYMANQCSFRQIGDRFNVTRSAAHSIIMMMLTKLSECGQGTISWPNEQEKVAIAHSFQRKCRISDVIGAVDGCHIKITRPKISGPSYMNRKGYYSLLLQGISRPGAEEVSILL